MVVLWRAVVIFGTPALAWLAWLVAPNDLLSTSSFRYLAFAFTLPLMLAISLFQKAGEWISTPGLTGRERDRMAGLVRDVRAHIWRIVGVCIAGLVVSWIVPLLLSKIAPWSVPLLTGIFVGVGLSYLIVLMGWMTEAHEFADKVKLRESRKESNDKSLKRIADAKKAKPASDATRGSNHAAT